MGIKTPISGSYGVLPEEGFIRLKELQKVIPYSRTKIWKDSKNGSFPASIKISTRVAAWNVKEVKAWIAEKLQSSTSKAPANGDANV